ncbi:MAG: carbohydrate kinase [Microbacterium sp. SCN 70-200]|uniref:rhamnulokinase n=1 Tax=unclassified Microbacterium TaxID=2609290 RepID=UPI000869D92E|nr:MULTISPECIES: rhamnulokinase family protein [unclassified Microbacterium]MBN9215486.1 rhamnulokinase [Microbacterium sp.]ODT42035.1 MAG: carbohydrate kinase [Microbacterium sp. SCN 70-200]OJV79520.1 MAG: rhamnulokinase [Microbacterium sp. 70-16]
MSAGGAVAAVDLGATSGRVIVGRVGPDTLETTTVARFPNTPVFAGDGLHWDILGLYGAALEGLREAFRGAPEIASIGIDSWAVDYGLLRGGRLLGNPFHYRDARTARGVATVHERVPHAELFERGGLQFLPFNTLYQLVTEPAEILEIADTALLIPDLLAYWLTGVARAEVTNASTTGLLRWTDHAWDDALISALGLPRGILPALVTPGERLGPLLPEVATSLGGSADVVAVGSHDTASAVVAVPMQADAAAYISCGTWGLVGVEVARPVLTTAALAANFTNEGGVDGRVRLLHNVMGLWVLSETVRGWEREGAAIDLPTLLDAAADVPASAVPVFDVDDPRFLPPRDVAGDMTTRIDAWCAEHDVAAPRTRAEYARSIVESLAQAFAQTALTAGRLGGVDVRTIHIVGGGALNALLCQRTADRAGVPVLAGPVEATALGNVLVQARAGGFVDGSLEALRDLVARTHAPRRFTPRA